MKKLMLGLVAVSLLASCGAIKTTVSLQDSKGTVTPGNNVGGGAIGIDGKGAPLSLSKGGLVLQAVNTDRPIASGDFGDTTDAQVVANIGRLAEWGFSQDAPKAVLSGVACPDTFDLTGVSFTTTISDTSPAPVAPRSVSITTSPISMSFKATSTGVCTYDAKIGGAVAAIGGLLAGEQLITLGKIITTGSINKGSLTGTFTAPTSVEGRTLTINFGGSSSYAIVTIL